MRGRGNPALIIPLQVKRMLRSNQRLRVTGALSFGGDQGTRAGRGHRSWTVGSEDAVLLLVQVDTSPPWAPLDNGT